MLEGLGFEIEANIPTEPRDASEVGSAAARTAWAEAARPVLLEAAGRYRGKVTYKQLADAVQEATGITTTQLMHQWIGDVLGRVTDDCQSRGEPLLSSLCVSSQGSVGQGYADAVERARGERPLDPDDHAANERLECYRHWHAEGLPRDGGTPLRTAHFTLAKKAPVAHDCAPQGGRPTQGDNPQGHPGRREARRKADQALPDLLHPGPGVRHLRLLRLSANRPQGGPTRARWLRSERQRASRNPVNFSVESTPCRRKQTQPHAG